MSKSEQIADKVIGIGFFIFFMGAFVVGIISLSETDVRKIVQPQKQKIDSVQCVHCGWIFPIFEHTVPDTTIKWK